MTNPQGHQVGSSQPADQQEDVPSEAASSILTWRAEVARALDEDALRILTRNQERAEVARVRKEVASSILTRDQEDSEVARVRDEIAQERAEVARVRDEVALSIRTRDQERAEVPQRQHGDTRGQDLRPSSAPASTSRSSQAVPSDRAARINLVKDSLVKDSLERGSGLGDKDLGR